MPSDPATFGDAELKSLYQRNLTALPRLQAPSVAVRALWWRGQRRLREWCIIPNKHYASWRLLWNNRSGGSVLFRGREYPLRPNCLVAVPPRTEVTARLRREVVHWSCNLLLGQPYDRVTPQVLVAQLDHHGRQLVDELITVTPEDGTLPLRQSLGLHVLLGLVLRELVEPDLGPQPSDQRIQQVIAVLNDDPNYSNSELAGLVGMSTNGFHRLFSEQIGMTPHAYVLQRKIDLACGLLLHSTETIDAIAATCGFNDRAYFARAFRRQLNLSPSEYRRQQQ